MESMDFRDATVWQKVAFAEGVIDVALWAADTFLPPRRPTKKKQYPDFTASAL